MIQIDGIRGVILILAISLAGCYEDKEGCLDVDASNYDVTADEACEDCCTLPKLSLRITHRLNGESFTLGDTLINNLGQSVILQNFQYYLTDVHLNSDGQSVLTNSDSISLITFDGVETAVADNYALITKSTFNRTLHTFTTSGAFEEITFTSGIPEVVNHSLELTLTEGHPLTLTGDSLYLSPEDGYVFSRTRIVVGPDLTDTLVLAYHGDPHAMTFGTTLDSVVRRGTDFSIPLRVDYACWFDDMDFTVSSLEALTNQFRDNILCGFSIE